MVRHFLKDDDITPFEQAEILRRAIALKSAPYSEKPFAGPQTVALIFDKTSTRTRVSFAVGVTDLGGAPLIIDSQSSQMGGKESVADTARVLGRQVSQIVWRTYSHAGLEEMAEYAGVPVINSLSDDYHPCQILADLMTIQEHKGFLAGLKIAYVGDASNNMANSYLIGCATAGMHVAVAGPAGYLPVPKLSLLKPVVRWLSTVSQLLQSLMLTWLLLTPGSQWGKSLKKSNVCRTLLVTP